MKPMKLACIRDREELISPNHMFSVSVRDAIDTRYLYTTSLHVSYRIQNDRHDIITKVIIIFLNISDGCLIFFVIREYNGTVSNFSRFKNQDRA